MRHLLVWLSTSVVCVLFYFDWDGWDRLVDALPGLTGNLIYAIAAPVLVGVLAAWLSVRLLTAVTPLICLGPATSVGLLMLHAILTGEPLEQEKPQLAVLFVAVHTLAVGIGAFGTKLLLRAGAKNQPSS